MEESPKHTTKGRLGAVCHHLSDKPEQSQVTEGDSGERQRTPGESTGFQGAEIDSADGRCPLAHSGVDHDAYTSLEQGSPCNLLSTVPRISHKALLLLSLTCVWSVAWPAWEKIQL